MAKKSKSKSATKSVRKPAKSARAKPAASKGPRPISTGKGAGPAEIGAATVGSVNAGHGDANLWNKYWSDQVESIEGVGTSLMWKGRKAMEAKGAEWMSTHTVHGASAEGPYVGATGFAIKFRLDVTDTTTGKRVMMEEIGVYTVKNGKVIREEFMYGSLNPVG